MTSSPTSSLPTRGPSGRWVATRSPGRSPRPPAAALKRAPVDGALRDGSMFQVRFHGRGGQGAVTAAEILSVAAFIEGKHAQALPSFGPERSGAPVTAFCRIDLRPIRTHEPIAEPDAVVVQDATLLHVVEVFQGL